MATSAQSNKQEIVINLTPENIDRLANNYDNMFAQGVLDTETHQKLSDMLESLKPQVERTLKDIAEINETKREIHAIVHEALLKYAANKD